MTKPLLTDISSLGFDNWQGSQGTAAKLVIHLCSSLQETGVKVEDITGVSLSSRRSSEQKRHLSVGDSLLKEVSDDQNDGEGNSDFS